MQRIATGTRKLDLFGAGKHGFTAGNPNSKIPATQLSAVFFNSIQEEVARAIEANGDTLDVDDNTQLTRAVAYGGKYNNIWLPDPAGSTLQPFYWSSEVSRRAAGSQMQVLVESEQVNQNAVVTLCQFLPAIKTNGSLDFEITVSCKTGVPTAQSHKWFKGTFWWMRNAAGVTSADAVTQDSAGLLSATVGADVGASSVGLSLSVAANAVYTSFWVQGRAYLNVLPYT